MENEQFVGIRYSEIVPDEIIEVFCRGLSAENIDVRVRKEQNRGPQASLDLFGNTMVTVVLFIGLEIGKGTLAEVGKNVFEKLKVWLPKLARRLREGSSERIAHANTGRGERQSKVLSFEINIKEGGKIVYTFDSSRDDNEWSTAFQKLADTASDHLAGNEENELSLGVKRNGGEMEIYARIKKDELNWEYLSRKEVIQEQIERSRARTGDSGQ